MTRSSDLFEDAIAWLQENYDNLGFEQERDIVWTLRTQLLGTIRKEALPLQVFTGYRVVPGVRESADLVITNEMGRVDVAVEFKYEPAHSRRDLQPAKMNPSVVFWGAAPSEKSNGVGHDVERIRRFVESGLVEVAYAVFVDEGRHFRHREPFPGSRWVDWEARTPEGHAISILWARWPEERND